MSGYRFDLHVHTEHSKDARGSILEIAQNAKAAGLHGFCITDHDTVSGHAEIDAAMAATGLLIVPGIEVTTAEGHVLAIGCRHPIPKGLGLEETARFIEQHGGVAVPAHPLRMFSGIGPSVLEAHARAGHIHAVEAYNARERPLVHENTLRTAGQLGLAATGGSDTHWIKDIGHCYTVFDVMPKDSEELVQLIRDGLCRPSGHSTRRRSVIGHQLSLASGPLRKMYFERKQQREAAGAAAAPASPGSDETLDEALDRTEDATPGRGEEE